MKLARSSYIIESGLLYLCVVLLFASSCYANSEISLYTLIALSVLQLTLILLKFSRIRKMYGLSFGDYLKGFLNLQFALLIVFGAWMLASLVATKSFNYGYPRLFLIVANGYAITEIFSFKDFEKPFTNVLSLIGLISLLMFITVLLFGEFSFSVINDTSPYTLSYFGFYFQIMGMDRNSAIFWEPGIFGSFCLFGIIIECLFSTEKKTTRVAKIVLFLIFLISTDSLASYILVLFLPPLFANGFLGRRAAKASKIYTGVLLCVMLIVMVFPDIILSLPFIQDKGASLTTRIYALLVDINIWTSSVKSLLFGVGTNYSDVYRSVAEVSYPGLVDSALNSFGFYVASFGIGGLIIAVYFALAFLFQKDIPIYVYVNLLIICLAIAFKEPHNLSAISFALLFYLLKRSDNKEISATLSETIVNAHARRQSI